MSTLSLKRRRDIARQKWQFIAVIVTVILGVMLFAGSFNAYLNLGTSLESTYERLVMADFIVEGADEGFVDTAASIGGVDAAIERRQIDVPVEVGDDAFLGRIIALPPDRQPAVNRVDIEEGSYLDPDDRRQVLVETHMASDFELSVGDSFVIAGAEVEVAGIVVSPEYLWPARDSQSLFTPPKSFGVMFVHEDVLDGITSATLVEQVLIHYVEDVDVEDVDAAVERAASEANASSTQTLAKQPSNESINLEITGLRTMAVAFPLLFLAAAGMAIYVVITRMVYSQRGVIGTLRATGFTSKALARHYRSYGLGVGLIGAVIGAILGSLIGRALTAVYTQIFGIPDLVAEVHLPTVVLALAFGALAGTLASVAPARTVARMAPAEAMRGDAPLEGGTMSLFERLIPPLRAAPVRWRMTFRGLGRNKRRSFTMVLGVVLALTLVLASWGMLDTMLLSINRHFNEVAIEDATAVFSVPVGDEQVEAVATVAGVEAAEAVIGLAVTIRNEGAAYTTLLEAYDSETEVHGFVEPVPATGVLLGEALKATLEVELHDTVTIEAVDLETTFEARIEGFVDEPLGSFAYMSKSSLAATLAEENSEITEDVLSSPQVSTVKAVFDERADADQTLQRIRDLDEVAAVTSAVEIRNLIDAFQRFFYVFVGIMLVFGGAMAFALIFNIVSVNVDERQSEFASMRANGLTHRKVANLIVGEVGILTAMGIVPGLIVGYLAAAAFMNTFASDSFPITLQMRPATYVVSAVAMFVVAGLSLVPAIRAVKRIDVGEIVRERAV